MNQEAHIIVSDDPYRDLFENAAMGIFRATPDGEFTAANRALAQMLGYASADDLMANVGNLARQIFANPHRHSELSLQLEAEGAATHFEAEFLRRDGTRLWVSQHARAVRDPLGELCLHEVFVHDITAHKGIEAQARHAQRVESIGTLTSGVAHDLNNILTPIMGCASMLHEDLPPDQRSSIVTIIETSVQRGAEILRQVLTFGRGMAGDRHPLETGSLIREITALVSETFPPHIGIEHFVAPGLWQINGDPTQIHQVLLNLCLNARDAMPAGGTLTLRAGNADLDENHTGARPASAHGPHVLIDITDTGTGIDPKIIERIFDPYFTTKPTGKGTGLGLSTTLGIVKSHGGFLHIQSEPHHGSTFKVYIPAALARTVRATTPAADNLPTGSGELVLVVDDERAVRSTARTVLEAHGYRTLLAANGVEALAIFSANAGSISAVLTDLLMPVMDGIELIQALRRLNSAVGVIASSGETEDALAETASDLNLAGILHKPYRTGSLLRAIHTAIHTRPADWRLATAG